MSLRRLSVSIPLHTDPDAPKASSVSTPNRSGPLGAVMALLPLWVRNGRPIVSLTPCHLYHCNRSISIIDDHARTDYSHYA